MVMALLSLGNNVFVDSLYEPALEPSIRTLGSSRIASSMVRTQCARSAPTWPGAEIHSYDHMPVSRGYMRAQYPLFFCCSWPCLVLIFSEMQPADSSQPSIFTPLSFCLFQPLCLMHTGKPTGMAVSHCITRFQTQLILTTCQIRYHGHCGIIAALGSSGP